MVEAFSFHGARTLPVKLLQRYSKDSCSSFVDEQRCQIETTVCFKLHRCSTYYN